MAGVGRRGLAMVKILKNPEGLAPDPHPGTGSVPGLLSHRISRGVATSPLYYVSLLITLCVTLMLTVANNFSWPFAFQPL